MDNDDKTEINSSLKGQLKAFKDILIHDITNKDFADIYAQTIAYGMFAARLHDPEVYSFNRSQAARLIPKTNPFLREFFQYIASYYLDERITWIVDALANVLRYTSNKTVKDKIIEKEVHKVQILDPATGTFLAEIVKHIYNNFKDQQGTWTNYVDQELIPRLNGFELIMTSYTMAHLKLEMLLKDTNYKSNNDSRFKIYLNNSLEKSHPHIQNMPFAYWLREEALSANEVKHDYPVMIVLGNPPYSGHSQNKDDWLNKLLDDYKKEPGTTNKLNEKNPKCINDDYVKFIRYGQYLIEKNKEGVLAFINNHSFLDNLTFRGMRYNLLKAFDKIYIMDLHGNSRKKETHPNGSIDQNVFDIQQGVSINIFVKTKKSINELAKVYHHNLYGEREDKYEYLLNNDITSVPYVLLENKPPYYFFVKKDFKDSKPK